MVVRTIKTTYGEAEAILNNRRHIFRSDKTAIKEGDIIQFNVVKQTKPVLHSITNKAYIVTSVEDCMTAPVAKGFKVIGFTTV